MDSASQFIGSAFAFTRQGPGQCLMVNTCEGNSRGLTVKDGAPSVHHGTRVFLEKSKAVAHPEDIRALRTSHIRDRLDEK